MSVGGSWSRAVAEAHTHVSGPACEVAGQPEGRETGRRGPGAGAPFAPPTLPETLTGIHIASGAGLTSPTPTRTQ